eukprot:2312550-Amphidinium_carterae.1
MLLLEQNSCACFERHLVQTGIGARVSADATICKCHLRCARGPLQTLAHVQKNASLKQPNTET